MFEFNNPRTFTFDSFIVNMTDDLGNKHAVDLAESFFRRGAVNGFFHEDVCAQLLKQDYTHDAQSKAFDLRHKISDCKIECKSFTTDVLRLAPSKNYGTNRPPPVLEDYQKEARQKDFLIGDATKLASDRVLRIVKISGADAAELGFSIKKDRALELFAADDEWFPAR